VEKVRDPVIVIGSDDGIRCLDHSRVRVGHCGSQACLRTSCFVGDALFFGKDRLREVEEEIVALVTSASPA
jgi:hypothetical protein